jgi:hypothetical protein
MFETFIETIVVVAIVTVVLVLAGRSLYRTMSGKKKGECCGGCDSCTCEDIKKQDC